MYSSEKDKVVKEWGKMRDSLSALYGPWNLKKIRSCLSAIFVCAPTLFIDSIVNRARSRRRPDYETRVEIPNKHILEVIGMDIGSHPEKETLEGICEDIGRELHKEHGLEVNFAGLIYHFYGDIISGSQKPGWNGFQSSFVLRLAPEDFEQNRFEDLEYQGGRVYIPVRLYDSSDMNLSARIKQHEFASINKDTHYGGIMDIRFEKGRVSGSMIVCISPGGSKIGPLIYGKGIELSERNDLELPDDNPTYLIFNMSPAMTRFKDIIINKYQESYRNHNRIPV